MPTYYLFDLDHTLLDEESRVPGTVVPLVRAHRHQVVLCSGRHPGQMGALVDQLGLTAPQSALNGALLFRQRAGHRTILRAHPLPVALARAVHRVVLERFPAVNFTWMDARAWHVTRRDAAVRTDERVTGLLATEGAAVPAGSQPLLILMIVPAPRLAAAVVAAIREVAPALTVASAGDGYLTITAPGVDKGRAVADLAMLTGVAPATMIAVGDDQNDLPLLTAVGHPGAVANAQPAVVAAASFTVPANTQGGVAYAFNRRFAK